MTEVIFDRVKNIVEKRENANFEHFLLFRTVFSKVYSNSVVKIHGCKVKGSPCSTMFLLYQRQKSSLYPRKTNVFGDILKSACLSVCPCVCLCICIQNTMYFVLITLSTDSVLTLSQTTNFTPFQTDRVCRGQFKI